MTDPTDRDEDAVALAGEYVLRLMDAEAHRAFERRLEAEPSLRALVREWDENLAQLADDIGPETPPAQLKAQIEARLFGVAQPAPRARRTWIGLLGGAVAAVLVAVAVLFDTGAPAPEPAFTSDIAAEDRSVVYAARVAASRDALEIERLEGAPPAGRVHQLWLIAEGADVPVSLGVLPEEGQGTVELTETVAAALDGGTLAVSVEPPGGSPTGQPTGAVVAVGALVTG